jgi:hypothetical protein
MNIMNPPWIEFPDIPPGSIGWRMGAGEDYIDKWRKWLDSINESERLEYEGKFPTPPLW